MANQDAAKTEEKYRCLVVDSGPIIKHSGFSDLGKKADTLYTVPAVLEEIRDAKARHLLENLPFELKVKDASPEGIQAVAEFARQTGDYASLSAVDLQVLGLLYDLEKEGCMDISHIRTTPKRVVGLGKIETLSKQAPKAVKEEEERTEKRTGLSSEHSADSNMELPSARVQTAGMEIDNNVVSTVSSAPRTWATLVNSPSQMMARLKLENDEAGQFSDAEEETNCNPTINGNVEKELQSEFPSLAASLTVPYEGSDDEVSSEIVSEHVEETAAHQEASRLEEEKKEEEKRKQQSLKPISKSGKLYNSFTKYGHLMKPKVKKARDVDKTSSKNPDSISSEQIKTPQDGKNEQSRIVGGTAFGGQDDDVEDDGEGWITCTKDISSMKAAGLLDPKCAPDQLDRTNPPELVGPAVSRRTACATTDFAMQNVILQMNLELLSVDGMKVRKLKSWVIRCGACYKVYTNSDDTGPLGKRLFCGHCGSDMMQRIAASVDGKTGRLRLHLSKKYKHNLRGTKFSLPKPGTGDRFQGDLLLREDQLFMGAWNQKVKMRSGGRAKGPAQSMFGRDIATNVGCHSNFMNADDMRVGFGRRNPNAAKGRERRGKKKKTKDKACGLRRY